MLRAVVAALAALAPRVAMPAAAEVAALQLAGCNSDCGRVEVKLSAADALSAMGVDPQ